MIVDDDCAYMKNALMITVKGTDSKTNPDFRLKPVG